jgi:GntR family transcriptional regulator
MTIFVRIEPSSSVPIYRQIVDQIKFQVATGTLKAGGRMPSVRELADRLAVNQNTVLKVYNLLCQEKVLHVDRGNGTFVADGTSALPAEDRRKIVAARLSEAVVQAIQFGLDEREIHELLGKEYQSIKSHVPGSDTHE